MKMLKIDKSVVIKSYEKTLENVEFFGTNIVHAVTLEKIGNI